VVRVQRAVQDAVRCAVQRMQDAVQDAVWMQRVRMQNAVRCAEVLAVSMAMRY
jgi:flavin-binding protein dodecin